MAACSQSPERGDGPITVIDDAGRTVSLERPARRIVSLVPARTDVILALGAADRLIARTRYDADPRLAGLPSVDNALTPSVEWLLAQQPDLVIAWPDDQARTVVTRLREMGVPVYASDVETITDIERAMRHLGVLLDLETEADSLIRAMHATLDSVRAAHAAQSAVSTGYVIGLDPPMLAGPGTFIHEVIEAAGGRNILADASARWPQVSVEQLLARDPDVIIVSIGADSPQRSLDLLRSRPGWRNLRAVRTGRLYAVDADSVNRPGPSVMATVRRFADLLHGGGP
jgi:ABC-type Fe3+-hydroxamate transport system substrate-binding protein